MEDEKKLDEAYDYIENHNNCMYCGLNLNTHDGSGFCPAGTEEFGGRR